MTFKFINNAVDSDVSDLLCLIATLLRCAFKKKRFVVLALLYISIVSAISCHQPMAYRFFSLSLLWILVLMFDVHGDVNDIINTYLFEFSMCVCACSS